MFFNCSKLLSLSLSFNTEKVIKMNSMFEGCTSLVNLKFGKSFYNTKLIDINSMFKGCVKLNKIDSFKNFPTRTVKYMNSLFYGCKSFTSLNLTQLNTSNAININSMFYDCTSLTSIDLSNFETSNVIDMSYLFYGCNLLTSVDLSTFKTNQTEYIDYFFYNCKSIKSISLSNFNTSNLKSMKSMFQGCSFIELLDLSNFATKQTLYMDGLFYDCNSLIRLDLTNFDVSNVISMGYMFYGCKSLTSLDLPDMKNLTVTNTSYMFAECSSLTSIDLLEFDSNSLMFADYMFSGCTFLQELNLFNWETYNITSMNYMFSGCSSITSLDLNNFYTPNLKSIRGLFYGCTLLENINIGRLDTSSVVNMEYMFYEDRSLNSLNFFLDENLNFTYFDTSLVTNMRYMFAYCSQLEALNLSFFDTKNVVDMSYMFKNCSNLTSVNLSTFDTDKIYSMEDMFSNCLNLLYINLLIDNDKNIANMKNILEETPLNMVFCINENLAKQLYELITTTKQNCYAFSCGDEEEYLKKRKKRILEGDSIKCVDFCKSYSKYDYQYDCYDDCPKGTIFDPNWESHPELDKMCLPLSIAPIECTLERLLLAFCEMDLYKKKFNNTNEEKEVFIGDIKNNFRTFTELRKKVINEEIYNITIYNETYQFSTLSYKNKDETLTFIDSKGCENILKQFNGIDDNDQIILFKIEYKTEEFRIPIVEYTIFNKEGVELNISLCSEVSFDYYIPLKIDSSEEYKYDPLSEYNNDICFQYTTNSKTDMILYDRRKEFNDYNMSLCESNCKFIGSNDLYVICECPVNYNFNRFLLLDDIERDNSIYRFKDNKLEKFNFAILQCFQHIFTSQAMTSNYASLIYIVLLGLNVTGMLLFCFKGYNILYMQARALSEFPKNKNNNKKLKLTKPNKNTKNIITTAHNPPPKIIKDIKNNKKSVANGGVKLVSDKVEKKIENPKEIESKLEAPSNLIDSKTIFNKGENIISKLNQDNNEEINIMNNYLTSNKDMEINMLSLPDAKKNDKRGCFGMYWSFLKTRQIFMCIIIRDHNSIIIKICFFFYIFGICLGINTIFFDDIIIQKIYQANGNYNIVTHLSNHFIQIIIATIISSIIKSISSLMTFTDIAILEINNNIGIDKEDKLNRALLKITYKSTSYFVLCSILLAFFWIYAGSFCYVFKNTQMFLIINAGISFGGVLILPFLYYFIPAMLRKIALGGSNNCFYKFSQFMELI